MKILAIDDQPLVLMSISKRLEDEGYEVLSCESPQKALNTFKSFVPDLILVDINMPGMNGIQFIEELRKKAITDAPVMVLSGNTEEEIIVEAFDLGITDYMKKPLSLNELSARVRRILPLEHKSVKQQSGTIDEHVVGVVIPCYNEEERLQGADFQNFIAEHKGYHLCFVNDGSTDKTLEVLYSLQAGNEDHISVFNCQNNGGKAEAVRLGMLHLASNPEMDYIGYLDADLSTNFKDFEDLVQTLKNGKFQIVSGSRIARMGADISKESARAIISKTINLLIQALLGMPFKDTQCGAKVMHSALVAELFKDKFVTKWLFDVELFMKLRLKYGLETAKTMICEQPLQRWIHADGSKLSMKDSLSIGFQLFKIFKTYRLRKTKTTARTADNIRTKLV